MTEPTIEPVTDDELHAIAADPEAFFASDSWAEIPEGVTWNDLRGTWDGESEAV
jgi:hypothetical protein